MNKLMKKAMLLVGSVLALTAIGMVQAPQARAADQPAFKVPYTQKGEQAHPQYSGCTGVRVTGTTEVTVSTGAAVLMGVYLSTGPSGQYLVIKDSSAAAGGALVIDKMAFVASGTAQQNGTTLPFPIRISNGIVASLNAAAAGEVALVCYIPR